MKKKFQLFLLASLFIGLVTVVAGCTTSLKTVPDTIA